ncbi:MAG TPA: retropepsin-like aspartic protease [Candidatus Hodarchaeales archaeon]|nr:retropepsin-like aspartic protease [Candidatus Hodarchaeales archaeon]
MKIIGTFDKEKPQILVPVGIKIDTFDLNGSAEFLIDTGSTISFISESTALKLGLDFSKLLNIEPSTGIGGEAEIYQIDGYTRLTFENETEHKTIQRKNFRVMKHNFCEHVKENTRRKILSLQGIIGMDMIIGFRFTTAGLNYTLEV